MLFGNVTSPSRHKYIYMDMADTHAHGHVDMQARAFERLRAHALPLAFFLAARYSRHSLTGIVSAKSETPCGCGRERTERTTVTDLAWDQRITESRTNNTARPDACPTATRTGRPLSAGANLKMKLSAGRKSNLFDQNSWYSV